MATSTTSAPVVDVGLALVLAAGVALHEWTSASAGPAVGRARAGERVLRAAIPPVFAVAATLTGLLDTRSLAPAAGVVYAVQRLAAGWWVTGSTESGWRFTNAPPTSTARTSRWGQPVRRSMPLLLGAATVGLSAVLVHLPGNPGSTPVWFVAPLLGGVSGLGCALAALRDHADWWRPVLVAWIAAAWAAPLAALSANWVILCLSSSGFALAFIQTWQRFLAKDRALPSIECVPSHARTNVAMGTLHAATWGACAAATIFTPTAPGAATLASDTIFALALLLACLTFFSSITGRPGTEPSANLPRPDTREDATASLTAQPEPEPLIGAGRSDR